nr:hypothetical protein [Tanacetum cinerariifolium]
VEQALAAHAGQHHALPPQRPVALDAPAEGVLRSVQVNTRVQRLADAGVAPDGLGARSALHAHKRAPVWKIEVVEVGTGIGQPVGAGLRVDVVRQRARYLRVSQ